MLMDIIIQRLTQLLL